ncbi:protease modulator HflC [Massilia sp. CF038]|uniref:protease modulator HflC n=1 Tax=Massilia sp. CF038 TaxID=1881045 RepID=UPI000919D30F|nr:protease modulator HflC [Massilia sp. CF038]SHG53825.1 membrane protease subunit HflC [Massilia sp. CF038]
MNRIITIFIGAIIALMLVSSTMFVVDQKHYGILFSFGKAGDVISKPGLYFKMPAPFQNVVYLDNRTLTLDTPDAERFITSEKKNILVDSFVKWRIAAPKLFYVSFNGDERRAENRLAQIVKAALNDEITKRSVHDVISGARYEVMQAIEKKVVVEAKQVGIEIVDVRLKRVDYVEEIAPTVYERMKAERVKAANELRSTGSAESEGLRAEADRRRTEILSKAFRKAEQTKGEGDAEASRIYAEAFGKSPEFYKFYRSLEAYRATFKNHGDVMVLDSGSEFFKYFRSPGGAAAPAPAKK